MKSGYKESLDQYKDLFNQPTWADSMGDAFSSAGKGSAKHPEDHQANALLSGIGGGLKGAANEQKRQQLSPMLQQAGQITAKAAEIEAQTQIATQSKMQVTQLFQQTAAPLAQLSQASLAGDINASNQLAKGVYARFKQGLGDSSMGDFDHYNNGTIYYENPESGVIEGRNIIGLMYQAGINPVEIWGQDAQMVEVGLSAGAKQNYENTEQMRQLEMRSKQADIDNKYSQTNYHNAQAGKLENEMNAPKEKYSKEILNNFAKQNSEWVNATREEHRSLNKEAQAYEDIAKYIQAEVDDGKTGRAGSSILTQIQRGLNNSNTESEKNQVLIQYASQPLMQGLKRIYTGVTSDRDIALFLEGIPSLDKNASASIQVAKARAKEIRQRLKEDEVTREVLENDFGYSEPYNSLAVQNKVKQRLNNTTQEEDNSANDASNSQNQDMVQVISPSGTVGMIPKNSLPAAQQKGYKIAQ